MPIPGEHIETIESKWAIAIDRMFDSDEAKTYAPDPHTWPAYLYSTASRTGYYRPPAAKASGPTVNAHVNHGRWICRCPYCDTAQHASRGDHWFYCAKCHNEPAGHQSLPVNFPDEHHAIDGLLLERPYKENRNWYAHETCGDLERENAENLAA